ncbi:MAG: hypothetical protein KGL48_15680 [Sphingomonadales bacterium]|nr:hypothetical protein [Sphingomonadales bacterium]MDE2567281.1 hypothetical protein [Sphingomonadales bacterium]
MELDDQLNRYFGTSDLASLAPRAIEAGIERILVEFGLEKDRNRRFAMWILLHILGAAPDLDVAFSEPEDREAARNAMDLFDKANRL